MDDEVQVRKLVNRSTVFVTVDYLRVLSQLRLADTVTAQIRKWQTS